MHHSPPVLRLLLLSLSLSSVSSSIFPTFGSPKECPYSWTVYVNGADTDGTSVILPADLHLKTEAELNIWAAEQIDHEVGGFGKSPCSECSIYDATGRKITHCSQLSTSLASSITSSNNFLSNSYKPINIESNQNEMDIINENHNQNNEILEVWVVAPNRWFVYPVGTLGRAVEIKRVPPPRGEDQPIIVESISRKPRAFHLHNFVTKEESDQLIEAAINNHDPVYGLHRSTTGVEHEVSFNDKRTSENAFDVGSPAAIKLKKRALEVLGMYPYDERLTDGLQVLRYNKTAAYNSHLDYLDDNGGGHDYDSAGEGSNRFATVLFYLSDVIEGGETVFPLGSPIDDGETDKIDGVYEVEDGYQRDMQVFGEGKEELFSEKSWQAKMIRQCRTKLAVKPKKAHAILFYSQTPLGVLDQTSLHGACPVLNGTKWAANLWIWNKVRLGYPAAPRKAGADKFDPTRAVSRDRLLEKNQGSQEASSDGSVSVKFVNKVAHKAVLFWEQTKFADFPINSELPVNSFSGHQWYVKDENNEILAHWIVGNNPMETFELNLEFV